MNRRFLDPERSSRELMLFGGTSFGLLLSVIGVVIASAPMAIVGLIFTAMGLTGFCLQSRSQ